jgi:hypothetical protein
MSKGYGPHCVFDAAEPTSAFPSSLERDRNARTLMTADRRSLLHSLVTGFGEKGRQGVGGSAETPLRGFTRLNAMSRHHNVNQRAAGSF